MTQTPEEIQADIDRQRDQLAVTIDRLGAKLDVKSRAGAKLAALKQGATTDNGKPRVELLALAGAVIGLALALAAWRRRA